MLDVRLIIERMKEVLGKENDKALSEELGVARTTFSNWKNRNNMPIDMILTFAQNHNLSLDWLIYGKDKTQALKATEKMLLTAFNELDDKQQLQAVLFVGNLAQGGAATNASVTQHAGENAYNVGGDFNFNQKIEFYFFI